ncbi:MAG: hypothetical protein HYY24_06985 [Verrucomicrobia bacterium]|nr:hypothetical protein [Verrucomicrobiota bacterium]
MPAVLTKAKRSALNSWLAGASLGCYGFAVPRKIRQLVADLERAGFARIHGGATLRLMADSDFGFQKPRAR